MSSLACIVFSLWGLGLRLSVYRVGLFFLVPDQQFLFQDRSERGVWRRGSARDMGLNPRGGWVCLGL